MIPLVTMMHFVWVYKIMNHLSLRCKHTDTTESKQVLVKQCPIEIKKPLKSTPTLCVCECINCGKPVVTSNWLMGTVQLMHLATAKLRIQVNASMYRLGRK